MIPHGPVMRVAAGVVIAAITLAGAASWLTWPFGEPSPPPSPPPVTGEPETPPEPAAPEPATSEPPAEPAETAEETAKEAQETTSMEEEAPDDEFGADWPRTAGWEETAYLCSACHSLAIVKQQGLTRKAWDELLDWMVEEQGMAELDPEEHTLILDYLVQNFGVPDTP